MVGIRSTMLLLLAFRILSPSSGSVVPARPFCFCRKQDRASTFPCFRFFDSTSISPNVGQDALCHKAVCQPPSYVCDMEGERHGDLCEIGTRLGCGPNGKAVEIYYARPTKASPKLTQKCSEERLVHPEPVSSSYFGYSLLVSRHTAFVVALSRKTRSSELVYVLRKSGSSWTQHTALVPPTSERTHGFGESVAFDAENKVVVVGAHNGNSALVYRDANGSFALETMLYPAPGGRGSFGKSVAVSGNTIVVGNPSDQLHGSVTVYTRRKGSWTAQARLVASDRRPGARFGWSVAILGEYVVIGAPNHSSKGKDSGSVYLYKELSDRSWEEYQMDGTAGERFGYSITFLESRLIIGAPGGRNGHVRAGLVYVLKQSVSSWIPEATLAQPDAVDGAGFGTAVSASGVQVLVGAPQLGRSRGAAYVFQFSSGRWRQLRTLEAADGEEYDLFGSSVGVSDGVAFVGAPDRGTGGSFAVGAVYTYCLEAEMRSTRRLSVADAVLPSTA